MPFVVGIDVMPAKRKLSVGELADRVGITPANLAGQPGDLLCWEGNGATDL
ncbi:helix-turn-helix domain-containing protein [Streptomyces sp. NPDC056468]|uniref:helix-turn-helix domain-containing protein n=1 Tax=Streptomyces sp. NPDC056468 TaxID=3345830 RepID=UPI003675E6CB